MMTPENLQLIKKEIDIYAHKVDARSWVESHKEEERMKRLARYQTEEQTRAQALIEELEQKGISRVRWQFESFLIVFETPDWVVSALGTSDVGSGRVVSYRNPDILQLSYGPARSMLRDLAKHPFVVKENELVAVQSFLAYREYRITSHDHPTDLCRRELWDRIGWEKFDIPNGNYAYSQIYQSI